MCWLKYISALIAIVCVILLIVSHYYSIITIAPLSKPDSHIELSMFSGRVSVQTSYEGPPNLTHSWHAQIGSMEPWRDAVKQMNEEGGMELPFPEDYPHYDYAPYSLSGPAGRWKWYGTTIYFPLWLPTLIFGLWPVIALTRHIKRRYFTHGICRKCGYDLRGSPSGVCPECGHEGIVAAK